jgi:hypothetical protein
MDPPDGKTPILPDLIRFETPRGGRNQFGISHIEREQRQAQPA